MLVTLKEALEGIPAEGEPFHQILRERSMRAVIYTPGEEDTQKPHFEDEVYIVVRGTGTLWVGRDSFECGPGDLLYVEAFKAHRFEDYSDDFTVYAVFGPRLQDLRIEIEECGFEEVAALEAQIPEFDRSHAVGDIERRIGGRPHLALVAKLEEKPVGYKLGYEQRPNRFYSWLGGVLPEARRKGVARALLRHQEQWCGERYAAIRVRSQNRYRGMMSFLLAEGYEIVALSTRGVVTFQKALRGSGT